jgi:ribosomal protein S27AE
MAEALHEISESEACPKCGSKLPPQFSTGRLVCGKCGWTNQPKNVPAQSVEKTLEAVASSPTAKPIHIERIILASFLENKPSNIRKIRQVKEKINVQLWNSKEPIIIDIQQYKTYVEELRKQHKANAGGSKKGVGVFLMIVGAIIAINGYTMDTTVSTSYGSVNNIGLINEQNKKLQLGGIAFIAGVIFYCLDRKESD